MGRITYFILFHICELQYSLTYDSFGPLGYPMWGLGTCLVKHFKSDVNQGWPLIQWIATGSTGCFRKPQMTRLTFTKGVNISALVRCFVSYVLLRQLMMMLSPNPPLLLSAGDLTGGAQERRRMHYQLKTCQIFGGCLNWWYRNEKEFTSQWMWWLWWCRVIIE